MVPPVHKAMATLGTESAFDVMARAQTMQAAGRDIINLGIGQPDFQTPPHVVEAAVRALRDGAHGYTAAKGILPLREAVAADIHSRRGLEIDPGHIVITPGGKPVIQHAIMMFAEPGAEIIFPDPGFPIYRNLISCCGATPVPVPLRERNDFAFSAGELLDLISPETRLIILNSPANPTGGITPPEEMQKLAQGLEEHPHIHILSDEIYARILYDAGEHCSPLRYESLRSRTILLDGWSKTYAMTGWRLGYGLWPDSLVAYAERLAINSYSCVNAAAQYAGIAALTGPQDDVDRMIAAFARRRTACVTALNALPGVSCVRPAGAFYAFPNISGTGMTSTQIQDVFLDSAGVATIAGTGFGDGGEGFLRVSYANSMDNIRRAVNRMATVLE